MNVTIGKIYRNNIMNLRLVSVAGNDAVFEHLMNGEVAEYIVGTKCDFDGDCVSWGWGSYNLTREQAMKRLGLEA